MDLPLVSIIIPCRNEEKFIRKCLDSIIAQDYPKERLEVLVVDGASKDRTKEFVKDYMGGHSFLALFDNPKKFTAFGLNIGIRNAKGAVIVRMDAHAGYEKEYISKCVKYLNEYRVDNVGGVMITVSRSNTLLGKAIVAVLSHRFGVGNAIFRIGAKEPVLVDTVFGGCYRKEVFEKIGYFNEDLQRGQDMDFNLRLRKSGGKILLVPEIKSFYYARSDFKSFLGHSFTDGVELISPLRFGVAIFCWRHVVPLVFVSSLITLGLLAFFSLKFLWLLLVFLGLYSLLGIYFSVIISFVEKDIRYLLLAPVVFAVLHIGYGLGSVVGLSKVFWSAQFWGNLKTALIQRLKANK
ncbi:MAG: glycosyltransferase family 2 protein [Candidatus Wildermuthbacteria bacterium]|nr:glycosyltransferase family 2 protein [Candidatus Wildermuthbacteria bacterium]